MKRVVLGLILTAAAACGSSPTSPSSLAADGPVDFSGLWQGSVKYTQCSGMRHCIARVGSSESFTLRARQTGARVRAVFTVSTHIVELGGEVLKDGSLELTGSSPLVSETTRDFEAAVSVQRFSIRLTPGVGLAGDLAYEMRANQTNSEFLAATLAADVVNASRSDLTMFASALDGAWRGRFIVRSCVPVGPYCYPVGADELGTLELRLAQNGIQVAGTFNGIPVTGQLSGRTLTLTGEAVFPASGGDTLKRITAWNASIDEFGRMSGTFDYLEASPVLAPRLGSAAHADLWQVVKVP